MTRHLDDSPLARRVDDEDDLALELTLPQRQL